jgi:hypothetical protein
VVAELGELLLDPGTSARDLVEILRALTVLHDPDAVGELALFVRRYHADQLVAYESPALISAAALLLVHAREPGGAREPARAALHDAADDPLCEPNLRAFIAQGLSALPADAEPAAEDHADDEHTPVLSAHL